LLIQAVQGTRFIHYNGHIKMMAAAQPFISGAISKTVNLPESATVDEITEVYIESWKLGLKAVAVYRDGCKKSQPLSAAGTKTALSKKGDAADAVAAAAVLDDNPNGRRGLCGTDCRKSGRPSPTSSMWAGMRATSPWASIRMECRESCSSPWPRKARRSAD